MTIDRRLTALQRTELTEHHVYLRLAKRVRCPENRKILERIADDEYRHYLQWRSRSGRDVPPEGWRVLVFSLIGRLLGFTFTVKLMERGEDRAQTVYADLAADFPEAAEIEREEEEHEAALLRLLDEERLRYTGSMVLGLNDALVELTGSLAGLTLALRDARLIALTGSITGIAAAFSMGASEYLATKSEGREKNPLKAALYTFAAYLLTVAVLILPYLVFSHYFLSLGCTLAGAIGIIAFFNFYLAVAKDRPFSRPFLEMAGLSLGVAGVSFLVGLLLRVFLGVEAG